MVFDQCEKRRLTKPEGKRTGLETAPGPTLAGVSLWRPRQKKSLRLPGEGDHENP